MFDEAALKRMETTYRECLKQDPSNHEARGSLAWCLLLQSVAQEARDGQDEQKEGNRVLEECLEQTLTAFHLAPGPGPRAEMQRVQALVSEAGGEKAVRTAQAKMNQTTLHLMRDMLSGVPTERPASAEAHS